MRGRTEERGRVTRIDYCKESGTFTTEEEPHPFLLRLAEAQQPINGVVMPIPLTSIPPDCLEKGKRK